MLSQGTQVHTGAVLLSRPGLGFLFGPLGRGGLRTLLLGFCLGSGHGGSQELGRSLVPSPTEPRCCVLGAVKEGESLGMGAPASVPPFWGCMEVGVKVASGTLVRVEPVSSPSPRMVGGWSFNGLPGPLGHGPAWSMSRKAPACPPEGRPGVGLTGPHLEHTVPGLRLAPAPTLLSPALRGDPGCNALSSRARDPERLSGHIRAAWAQDTWLPALLSSALLSAGYFLCFWIPRHRPGW